MAVNVENDGIIVVDDCVMVDCSRFITQEGNLHRVDFRVIFSTEEESRRFYNLLNASIMAKCLHVHFEQMDVAPTGGRAN